MGTSARLTRQILVGSIGETEASTLPLLVRVNFAFNFHYYVRFLIVRAL